MNIAVGTSACQVLGASSFSLWHHMDNRWLGVKVALWMGSGIPLGVWFGSSLVQRMMPMLFYLVGQEIKAATRTSSMLVFMTGLFSTIVHARAGNINWTLVACLISGAFFGTHLGAWLQHRATGKRLRQYFAFVVLTATLMVGGRLLLFYR